MAVGSDGGHPAVWTTTDGQTWTTIGLNLPPGASAAVLQQVAIDGDHVVALGQETKAGEPLPFAEFSRSISRPRSSAVPPGSFLIPQVMQPCSGLTRGQGQSGHATCSA